MKTLTIFILMMAGIIGAEPLVTDFVPGIGGNAVQFSLWTAPTNAPDSKAWLSRCLAGSTNIFWDSSAATYPCLLFVSADTGSNAIPAVYSQPETFDLNQLPPTAPAIVGTHRP